MYTTKAQMEMMGLAVIVILLTLGMFFVVKFTLLKEPSDQVQTFQQRQIASGFLSTLLTSNAGCGGTSTFARLVEEIPNEFSLLNCQNTDLEDYFGDSVTIILGKTLDVWNFKYEFFVLFPLGVPDYVEDIKINNECDETLLQAESKTFPIPSDYGIIRVGLKICY